MDRNQIADTVVEVLKNYIDIKPNMRISMAYDIANKISDMNPERADELAWSLGLKRKKEMDEFGLNQILKNSAERPLLTRKHFNEWHKVHDGKFTSAEAYWDSFFYTFQGHVLGAAVDYDLKRQHEERR